MKKGDYIFYTNQEGGTEPAKIVKVHRKMLTITVDNIHEKRVSKNKCILQDEWLRLNEPDLYAKKS